jgi:uncharacterized protein (DUF305 family)
MSSSDPDLSFDQLLQLQQQADAVGDGVDSDDGDGDNNDVDVDDDDDDGTIVLPWWQHPVNIATMLVALALIGGIAGWMIGDSAGRPHNDVDTGLLHDMREHHEQAVLISQIYDELPDTDPGLRIVADTIEFGQSIEIGRMIQILRDFGEPEANEGDTSMAWMGMPVERGRMPGMATQEQVTELQSASGRAADELFAELMIDHHLGGVHMAEYARDHGESDVVESFAESIINSQQDEIAEIERELAA